MICNECQKGKLRPISGCGGEVVYRCENCNKEYTKKYTNINNSSIEFLKDNYDSPQEWKESTIEAYSFHGEIPKEYLDKLNDCQTWDDVEKIYKEVIPYLKR